MTTGRINQVTTIQSPPMGPLRQSNRAAALSPRPEFVNNIHPATDTSPPSTLTGVQAGLASRDRATLFPRSHKFQAHFSSSPRQGSWPSVRTTSDRHPRARSRGGSPSGYLTDRFSHRRVIHNLPYLRKLSQQSSAEKTSKRSKRSTQVGSALPSQCILNHRHVYDRVHSRPTAFHSSRGLLIKRAFSPNKANRLLDNEAFSRMPMQSRASSTGARL